MNYRKIVFSLLMFVSFSFASFGNTNTSPNNDKFPTVSNEIKELIEDVKLDFKKLNKTTVMVKFIINENNELIVLSTNEAKVDESIKNALNYKKIKAGDAKHNFVYIVPVKFKA